MATSAETADFLQTRLKSPRFHLRRMFGEYALYADDKVVALLCDDRLYVKIHAATKSLDGSEQAPPYPGAKPHYVVEDGVLGDAAFAQTLLRLAAALPAPKPRKKSASGAKPRRGAGG